MAKPRYAILLDGGFVKKKLLTHLRRHPALRDMVRQIIVVTGDSDFVPAFKFVRREGVRVILDMMGDVNGRIELRQNSDIVL